MKIKILYLSLFLVISFSVSVVAQEKVKTETIFCETWDKQSDTWLRATNIQFFYRFDDNKATVVTQEWDDLVESWEDAHKQDYTYDHKDRIVEVLIQERNQGKKSWVNVLKQKKSYQYDDRVPSLHYIIDTAFFWQKEIAFWEPVFLNAFAYKNNNLMSKKIYIPSSQKQDEHWIGLSSENYWYKADKSPVESKYFIYDLLTLEKKQVAKDAYVYLQNNVPAKKIHKTKQYQTNNWKETKQEVYQYNGCNQPIQKTYQSWSMLKNDWENKTREIIQYDDNQNVAQTTSQVWNELRQEWENEKRCTYTLVKQKGLLPIRVENIRRKIRRPQKYQNVICKDGMMEQEQLYIFDLENIGSKPVTKSIINKFPIDTYDIEAGILRLK